MQTIEQEYNEFKKSAEKRETQRKKQNIVNNTLLKSGADPENIDLLLNDFDFGDMKLKDGNIIGLDEYIEPVKEKRSRLFLQKEVEGNEPGKSKGGGTNDEQETKLREVMGLDPK